jgi:hypothetical protein
MGTIKCDATTSYEMIYYCPSEIESGGSLLDIILSHLPSFTNPFKGMASPNLPSPHLSTISFFSLPTDLLHRAKGNDGRAWLIMACSVGMVTSFVFLAVRKWRRHTYHQVEDAAQAEGPDQFQREPILAWA